MTEATFLFVTIDANDAPSIAAFWAAVLGTRVADTYDDGRFIFLAGRDGLPVVCIQSVREPKQGKTRVHLDLGVADLDGATARIVELGGSWEGQERRLESTRWRTLADPEGTEFDIALED